MKEKEKPGTPLIITDEPAANKLQKASDVTLQLEAPLSEHNLQQEQQLTVQVTQRISSDYETILDPDGVDDKKDITPVLVSQQSNPPPAQGMKKTKSFGVKFTAKNSDLDVIESQILQQIIVDDDSAVSSAEAEDMVGCPIELSPMRQIRR